MWKLSSNPVAKALIVELEDNNSIRGLCFDDDTSSATRAIMALLDRDNVGVA
jgi:hypothetical protein